MTWSSLVRQALVDRGVYERLRTAAHAAVVQERIARGGGATDWFVVTDERQLDVVADQLRPGSAVSFYFGDQFTRATYTAEVHAELLQIMRTTDVVVALDPPPGEVLLDWDFYNSPRELAEFTDTLGSASVLHFGPYPGRDDDGIEAISLILPDRDGVVRPHPH